MHNSKFILCLTIMLISAFSMVIFSCSSSKDIRYFQDLTDTTQLVNIPKVPFIDPVIHSDDILDVSVQTVDPNATVALNSGKTIDYAAGISASNITVGQQAIFGRLVDKEGNINMPVLGLIKVAGLTTVEARELIKEKASYFFKDPIVVVRLANFKVTVLGEVTKPGTYVMPNEKVTILDALGYSGDLTIFGRRENVLLMRVDSLGEKQVVRINLKSSQILSSPWFYLQPNDVIYVEPSKRKIAATDAAQTRTITLLGSLFSVLIVLISRI